MGTDSQFRDGQPARVDGSEREIGVSPHFSGFGIRAVVILIGFTAAIAQIVLLRELMAVFYGNEISIGLTLASWLVWTAAGSGLAGRVAAGVRDPRRAMAGIQVLLAAALPGTVLAVRAAREIWQTVPGEVLGPGPMLATSLAVLAPLCVLSGALFTAGSRIFAAETGAGEATGTVYLWEAVGAAGGGLVVGLVLIRWMSALEIAWLLAVLNLVAACGRRRMAVVAVVGIAAVVAGFGVPRRVERISQERFWRGQKLMATRNSVYGNLAVTGTEGSRTVYENGVVLFSAPDPAAAEEDVDYALLEHPAPRSLLLIGGGFNGCLAEALRHPGLERVDYVELDPAVLELAREYFPDEWRAVRRNPRVGIHVMDGRLFVKTTARNYDVVIVNLPEPQNAQLNRFFTAEFFGEVERRLTGSGVLSFQLRASENYIGPELAQFLRTIDGTLRAVFPEVAAIPGDTVHFFAARRAGVLARGADELLARIAARKLRTNYVSEYFIPFRMSPDRMAELEEQIRPERATPVNRDFAPVAYYFDAALWSSQFQDAYRRLFGALAGVDFGVAMAALGIGAAVLAAGRRRRRVAGACTAAAGFTTIGLEILLLLGFQAVYGYVYRQLALVIAGFMAGMALGSWQALRRAGGGMRRLGITQFAVAAAPVVLVGLLEAMGRAAGMAFPLAAMGCGMLGGFEFALAGRIFFGGAKPSDGRGLGTLYALDLAGSCAGAILFSTWFVPVYGFAKTALLAAMVSIAPAAAAMLPAYEEDRGE